MNAEPTVKPEAEELARLLLECAGLDVDEHTVSLDEERDRVRIKHTATGQTVRFLTAEEIADLPGFASGFADLEELEKAKREPKGNRHERRKAKALKRAARKRG